MEKKVMLDLKKYLVFRIIVLSCFVLSFGYAQTGYAQTDTSEDLITPVLAPAIETSSVGEPQEAKQGGSFLPKGLQNIFQQKPKASPAQNNTQVAATAATSSTSQQQAAQTSQTSTANRREGFQVGNIATDFRLINMEGQTVQLASLRGRPVVLNFWGLNCPPCIEELPILQKADREINGQYRGLTSSANAHFVLVSLRSNTEETKPFLEDLGIHMNTLIEATIDQQSNLPYAVDDTESVFRDYRAFGLPTTFLIDPSGVITSKRVGAFVNEEELSHYLQSININWQPVSLN